MGISAPVLIVIDRETALMKALDSVFPESVHLLCTWHVNMQIAESTFQRTNLGRQALTLSIQCGPNFLDVLYIFQL